MHSLKILILDANTTYHIGNTALLDSSLAQLKTGFPGARFTILAFDPVSIAQMFDQYEVRECLWAKPFSGFSRWRKITWLIGESVWALVNALNFLCKKKLGFGINPNVYTFSATKQKVLAAYAEADIIVSISGEMLSGANVRRIGLFLYGYWLGHLMDKVVAIFPQSMGPFEKPLMRIMVKYVLERCDLILPRDKISLAFVEKLNLRNNNVHLVPDVAVNQLYIPPDEAMAELSKNGLLTERRPIIGITISKFKDADFERYFAVMRGLCLFVTNELVGSIIIFSPNMPYRNEVDDLSVATQLYNSLPEQTNIIMLSKLYSARQIKGLLGVCDVFVTTRMHVAILATMNETPTITINTQPKLRGYMEMISQDDWSCEIKAFDVAAAREMLQSILNKSAAVKSSLQRAKQKVSPDALAATRYLRDAYQRKITSHDDKK